MPNAPEYEPGASSWWNSSVSFEQRGCPPLRKMWLTAAIISASAACRDIFFAYAARPGGFVGGNTVPVSSQRGEPGHRSVTVHRSSTRATFAMDDSDDEAPVAIRVSEARDIALAREATRPTREQARASQKAAQRKLKGVVTADLRGDDYLPSEVLEQLPPAVATASRHEAEARMLHPAKSSSSGDIGSKRTRRTAAVAVTSDTSAPPPDGLPHVIKSTGTVEVAVLDDKGGPRLHAPVRSSVRTFMQEQLYGDRNRRAPAATLSSLKPTRGRFGPASNFAAVPFDAGAAASSIKKKGKKGKKGQGGKAGGSTGFSSLEKMAAQIMARSRNGAKAF